MRKIIAVVPVLLLLAAFQPLVLAQQNWDMIVVFPRNATAEQRKAIEGFNNEIQLASQASDRNGAGHQ